MLDNQPNLEAWLNGGEVKRYHQWPMVHRQQTNAEHTYNMLLISTHLYYPDYLEWDNVEEQEHVRSEFLYLQQSILFHDVAEGRRGTSDISSWAKARMPGLKRMLDGAEKQIAHDLGYEHWMVPYNKRNTHRLKMCDKLELMWTILSQRMLGNRALFDASWFFVLEMIHGMKDKMEDNETKLFREWVHSGDEFRGR